MGTPRKTVYDGTVLAFTGFFILKCVWLAKLVKEKVG